MVLVSALNTPWTARMGMAHAGAILHSAARHVDYIANNWTLDIAAAAGQVPSLAAMTAVAVACGGGDAAAPVAANTVSAGMLLAARAVRAQMLGMRAPWVRHRRVTPDTTCNLLEAVLRVDAAVPGRDATIAALRRFGYEA